MIGRYAAGCPMTVDGLRDVIGRIIRGHHTEIDRLLAENKRLRSVLCMAGACLEVKDVSACRACKRDIADVLKPSTSAGKREPCQETPSHRGVNPGKNPATPKAEAKDAAMCECGHESMLHFEGWKTCLAISCHCSRFHEDGPKPKAKTSDTPKCGKPCPFPCLGRDQKTHAISFTSEAHIVGCELPTGHIGKHMHKCSDPVFCVEWESGPKLKAEGKTTKAEDGDKLRCEHRMRIRHHVEPEDPEDCDIDEEIDQCTNEAHMCPGPKRKVKGRP